MNVCPYGGTVRFENRFGRLQILRGLFVKKPDCRQSDNPNRANLRIAAVRKTNCGGKPQALDAGVVPFSRKTCQTRKKRARKSAVQNSGEHVSAACSARKTYENGEAKENVDNKGTPVSGEDKEGTGNGSESRQRKAGATIENPAQFLKTGSFED